MEEEQITEKAKKPARRLLLAQLTNHSTSKLTSRTIFTLPTNKNG